MAQERYEHVFNCSADDYWDKLFFDEDYNRQLFLETLRFEQWRVLSQEASEVSVRRVVDAVPRMPDLPGPLKAVVKEGLGYREDGTLVRAERRYRLQVTTKSLSGKVLIEGETSTVPINDGPLGQGRCTRIHRATVEAKVFGVGRLIEGRLMADMRKSYDKAAIFSNQWIAQRAG